MNIQNSCYFSWLVERPSLWDSVIGRASLWTPHSILPRVVRAWVTRKMFNELNESRPLFLRISSDRCRKLRQLLVHRIIRPSVSFSVEFVERFGRDAFGRPKFTFFEFVQCRDGPPEARDAVLPTNLTLVLRFVHQRTVRSITFANSSLLFLYLCF